MCGCWYLQPGPELTAGLGTEGGRHTDGRRVGHLDGDGEARGRVKSTLLALVVVRRERSGGVVDVEDGCRSRGRWSVCWELTMVGVAGNDGRRSLKWGAFRGELIPCQCPCHVTSSPNVAGASSAVNAAAVLAAGQLGLGRAAQGTAALWLAAARLQWRRPAWASAGGRKPLTPPSSSSTHAATRISVRRLQFIK